MLHADRTPLSPRPRRVVAKNATEIYRAPRVPQPVLWSERSFDHQMFGVLVYKAPCMAYVVVEPLVQRGYQVRAKVFDRGADDKPGVMAAVPAAVSNVTAVSKLSPYSSL
jgi:hypothetical protein